MTRHIIIGDVHGMFNELWKLFDTLVKPDDKVVFVGDLVDKGPDSTRVVQFVREMSRTHDITLVEGNHEEKHRRFRKHCIERPDTAKTMSDRQPELREITDQLIDADIEFLNFFVQDFWTEGIEEMLIEQKKNAINASVVGGIEGE